MPHELHKIEHTLKHIEHTLKHVEHTLSASGKSGSQSSDASGAQAGTGQSGPPSHGALENKVHKLDQVVQHLQVSIGSGGGKGDEASGGKSRSDGPQIGQILSGVAGTVGGLGKLFTGGML